MSSLESFLQGFESTGGVWEISIQVIIVILLTLLVDFAGKKILDKLFAKLKSTANPWDDGLVEAMRRPVSLLIWVLGISFSVEIVRSSTDIAILDYVQQIREILVIYSIAWFMIRFVRISSNNLINKPKAPDKASVEALAQLTRLAIIIASGLVVLETMGFSISGLLAFGGVGGIAIGFAAKDLLANFFGGLMIHLDRPFSVGDWVRSPDRQIEGTIERIGWRLTCIRTFDKRPLYLPNAAFTSIAVENPSRMSHRRIYETIGVRYDDADKVRNIVQDVKSMLLKHDEIDQTQTMIVNFNQFAPSSLDFFIYTFTRTTDWIHYHEVKEDVLLKVLDIIIAHGAEAAFPTSTIHIPDGVRLAESGLAESAVKNS